MKTDIARRFDDHDIRASVARALAIHHNSEGLADTYEYQSRGYSVMRVSDREYGVFWRGIRIDSNSPHTLSSAKKTAKRIRRSYAQRTKIARELLSVNTLAN